MPNSKKTSAAPKVKSVKDKTITLEQPLEVGQVLGVVDTSDALYHGVYSPLWRPQIDCGIGSLGFMQHEIQLRAESLDMPQPVFLEWQRDEQGNWYAVGNDGSGETTLPIARIERVNVPANQWGQ